jgi:hypothetical protein
MLDNDAVSPLANALNKTEPVRSEELWLPFVDSYPLFLMRTEDFRAYEASWG